MSDWDGLIRRYRKAQSLTQAAFAEVIGVEQATVSRWERGLHVPDLDVQRRLRDLLCRRTLTSDILVFHRVRCALNAAKIANKQGKNFAASAPAARLHGVDVGTLSRLDYCHLHTDILENQWRTMIDAGFFSGEIASVHVYNTWRPAGGDHIRYCEGFWTPAVLSDGEIMLISEWNEIDEATYHKVDERQRLTATTMDELLS